MCGTHWQSSNAKLRKHSVFIPLQITIFIITHYYTINLRSYNSINYENWLIKVREENFDRDEDIQRNRVVPRYNHGTNETVHHHHPRDTRSPFICHLSFAFDSPVSPHCLPGRDSFVPFGESYRNIDDLTSRCRNLQEHALVESHADTSNSFANFSQ